MSPNAEMAVESREPPPPVSKQRSRGSIPGLIKKVRSGGQRSKGSTENGSVSMGTVGRKQQQLAPKKKGKKRRKKEKNSNNKSIMSMFWKKKEYYLNPKKSDPFSRDSELKELVLYAFDKTETRALLDNAGGKTVLNELDLVAILREAIRHHQEVHPGSFAKYEELPESFLQSLVCVCVSSMVRHKVMFQDKTKGDVQFQKVGSFGEDENPTCVDTSFSTIGSGRSFGSQGSLSFILGTKRKAETPPKIPTMFQCGTNVDEATENRSKTPSVKMSEKEDLKQVLKLLEVNLKRSGSTFFDNKRSIFDDNSLEDDDSEYYSYSSDDTLVSVANDESFDKAVTDVYCGCLDQWDGGFGHCVLTNPRSSPRKKTAPYRAREVETPVTNDEVSAKKKKRFAKMGKRTKPNAKLPEKLPVPPVMEESDEEEAPTDVNVSFVSGLTDIFADDNTADKEEPSATGRTRSWLSFWDNLAPPAFDVSFDTIHSDENQDQPEPVPKTISTSKENQKQLQPVLENDFAVWESNENQVMLTHTPSQPPPPEVLSTPTHTEKEDAIATPEEKEIENLKTPTNNATPKKKKRKSGIRITVTAGSGTPKEASMDPPLTECIENLRLEGEAPPAPQKAAFQSSEERAEELRKSVDDLLQQPPESGNQEWHDFYSDHLSSSQGKDASPLASDKGEGSKPEEEKTGAIDDDSMDSDTFFSAINRNESVNHSAISSDSEWDAFAATMPVQEPLVITEQETDGMKQEELADDNGFSQPVDDWFGTPKRPEPSQGPKQEGRQEQMLQLFSQRAQCCVAIDDSTLATPPRDNRSPQSQDLFCQAQPSTDEIRQPALM